MGEESEQPERRTAASHWLHCRLTHEEHARLRVEASAKGFANVSAYVRDVLHAYWQLEEDTTGSNSSGGTLRSGLVVQRLLAEAEERISSTQVESLRAVHRRIDRVLARLTLLEVMVAQSYRGFLSHTPPVPDARRADFIRSSADRYQRWERSISAIIEKGGLDFEGVDADQGDTSTDEKPNTSQRGSTSS